MSYFITKSFSVIRHWRLRWLTLSCALFAAHAVSFLVLTSLTSYSTSAGATPLIALKEADNCDGCHDGGRGQRPVLDRRCTLDCQGCHVDPAGAGPRNQWGQYYTQADLSTFSFIKPQDPLKDTSRFDVHYDGRIIRRTVDSKERTFPMSSELSLRLRPFVNYLNITYQAVFLGRVEDQILRGDRNDSRRYRERYALALDNLPMNTYIRAYRGTPMYGIRRPNHTLWIRERLGLDQFATTEAVEVGGTPNVPFMRFSQMRGDPYAKPEDRQKGSSFHGGFRGVSYGWHVNGSTWKTSSEKADIEMKAVGAGLKPWKFVLYGERNWRHVKEIEHPAAAASFESLALRLHPSSEITEYTAAFTGIPGIMTGYVLEELHDPNSDSLRRSLFADFHPIPFFQFELWRRFESGSRSLIDTLAIAHLYFDF